MQDRPELVGMARTAPPEKLWAVIQQATEEVLLAVLENPACEPFHVIAILRSPRVTPAVAERVYADSRWLRHYRVKVALVHCRAMPYVLSSQVIYELFWYDLAQVALNPRIDPRLRQMAERLVIQKLEEMAVGEKMVLARVASRNLIVHIRNTCREAGVLLNLLRNPRLVEEDLLALLQVPQLPVEFIRALAALPQWCNRPAVRMALLRHPHTPVHVVAQLIPRLQPSEVLQLLQDRAPRPIVRRLLRELRRIPT
jgi:hypothetical protein